MLSLPILLKLTHRRWTIPLLAYFHTHPTARFVSMAHHLACGRGALSDSLKLLLELGLVARNSGHGHPMRPEYLLTQSGKAVAQRCSLLHNTIVESGHQALAYRKWSLPLVAAVGSSFCRFGQLRESLNPVSPRALTLGLKSLERQEWLTREIVDCYPPETRYQLLPHGQTLWHICRVDGQ